MTCIDYLNTELNKDTMRDLIAGIELGVTVRSGEEAEYIIRIDESGCTVRKRSETTDLRPCPFCGGKATYWRESIGMCYIRCTECSATGPFDKNKDVAIADWNRRASE